MRDGGDGMPTADPNPPNSSDLVQSITVVDLFCKREILELYFQYF
jgi:hypothetical protein